ncbi:hypothetical protein [Yoonia litorea]|uniref:Heme oxygenase n=1 Tax=Yoonia litorea TaxID=1123755 RepID=A0A1I6MDM7_9RHOB|nr:hypothetical protein [Yoonia litorea]SFS13804.1 hypothetical protein SAMN05444714_1607 [Yoonia litorea]
MIKHTQTSLRARLRIDTYSAHESLDHEVSRFNLTMPDGLMGFLNMQSAALQTLSALDVSAKAEAVIQDLLERATRDLRKLSSSTQTSPAEIEPVHPLAIDYAISGSRLGSRILKKRWQATTNAQVRQADAYFSAPSYIEIWASFCDTAEELSSTGPLADQIVRDADRIFHMYRECARAVTLMKGETHA